MIRRLQAHDAQSYLDLRKEALLEAPLAFVASPEDDLATSIDDVRKMLRCSPDSIIIGAFRECLVGMVGLYRDPHAKASHKVHLWGMYVTPDHRGQGLGAELLDAALQHARALAGVVWVHLCVSSVAPGARRLYERAGFRLWGTEPDSLRHQDDSADEYHMALDIQQTRTSGRRPQD